MEIACERKKNIWVFSFLFMPLFCSAQCYIKTDTVAYFYNDSTCILEHSIINKTLDTFYLWIDEFPLDEDSVFQNIENGFLLKYLYYSDCELGLHFKGTDSSINVHDKFIPTIGCDFLKKIMPGDTFFVMTHNLYDTKFKIIYVRQSDIKQRISLNNIEPFLYKKNHIAIFNLSFQKDNKNLISDF